MAKAPVTGNVKTRLANDIGSVNASQFYRRTCKHLLKRVALDPRWTTYLAITPISALSDPFWPAEHPRFSQGEGSLGVRMQNIFNAMPPGPVIIIGTDIPAINSPQIENAFKALKSNKVIIGPSGDGGYWLIGQRRTPKTLSIFKDVRWSTNHAMEDTIKNIKKSDLNFTATLEDVDNGTDYNDFNKFSTRLIINRKNSS